ncbi:MAG: hypothetical protein EA396_05560 [Anaerolineaceae bacterium]|nr:MAG: hypothetical protein EA396_05560 [Anaerolineaceae bacterium]
MKIGTIQANKGEKAYGFFKTGETHGRFPVHIPLHIIAGNDDGPTLVVQSGTSGLEIEPALILPQIVKELEPAQIKGTIVIVPLMNDSGFNFEQINSAWDNKHLNSVGRGKKDGTVSEQLIYQYYESVLSKADAIVDIRTGAQWSYHRYAGVFDSGEVEKSTSLAVSLGLPQVLVGQPEDQSMALEAAKDGKAVVTAHIGGGPGLRDHRQEDMARVKNAVLNAMRHLNMIDGQPVYEDGKVAVIENPTVLTATGERGFIFMDSNKRGTQVEAGAELGYVRHPFTGEVLEKITTPRAGIVLHAGVSWPVPLEGLTLAMLGDLKQEVTG